MQTNSLRIKFYRSQTINDTAIERPHNSIGLATPMAYYQQLMQTA